MEIHARVRQIRKSKGITQTFVAKELGVTAQTYNSYELGRRSIKAETLEQISRILNEPVENFFKDNLHETKKLKKQAI